MAFFPPPSYQNGTGFLPKCTLLKVDLLKDNQIYCLKACMRAIFSPEIFQAGAVKGLNKGQQRCGLID